MAPLLWHLDSVVFDYTPISAVSLCLLMSVAYVGSLHIYATRGKSRDDPEIVKARFLRVSITCTILVPFLWLLSSVSHDRVRAANLFVWIGLRFEGFFLATILPLLLTMILFLGPLYLHYVDGIFGLYIEKNYWTANFRNLIWLRNHIMAPLSEEMVFRAYMAPLLVPAFGESNAVFICPLFFGVAHFHHMIDKVNNHDMGILSALSQSFFQFCYTTLFGIYSAFLFLRTGHFISPVIVHAFCNHMGFPEFQQVGTLPRRQQLIAVSCFLIGLVMWSLLLFPLTSPTVYGNSFYNL